MSQTIFEISDLFTVSIQNPAKVVRIRGRTAAGAPIFQIIHQLTQPTTDGEEPGYLNLPPDPDMESRRRHESRRRDRDPHG